MAEQAGQATAGHAVFRQGRHVAYHVKLNMPPLARLLVLLCDFKRQS